MVSITSPFAPLRHARRFAEILEALVRYGFESFVVETGLDKAYLKGRAIIGVPVPDEATRRLPTKVRVRLMLEKLGPTFIKLGQILSTRPDLIPPDMAEEFKRLQDDVGKIPFQQIRKRLEEELGEQLDALFASIEEQPLAAASMAQTHRAVLKSGEKVVIKILRPGIESAVQTDMEVMTEIARFVENHFRNMGYSPIDVVHEFAKQIRRELDFETEGRSTERLRGYFRDNPNISFPKVYWEATTKRVLTLEEAVGTLLSRLDLTTLTPAMRRRIVENGADAVFQMCLEFGFFHADPHPGNIIVTPTGPIYFIDCGMTGHIEERMMLALADFVAAVVSGDLDKVLRQALVLADADPALLSNRSLRADAWDIVSRFQAGTIESIDITALLEALFELLRTYRIKVPADLVFLMKAMTTVQGVALAIDPEFDLITYVRPHLVRLAKRQYGLDALAARLRRSAWNYAELVEDFPDEIRALITQLRRQNFSIRLEHKGLRELEDTIMLASKYVSAAMLVAAVVVGGSLLMASPAPAGQWSFFSMLGLAAFTVAGLFAFVLLVSIFRKQ
jgi:ubiquinone biosynthesis protein